MEGFMPLHDRVMLRRIEAEEKTPGGIIIPDTAKEKPVEAEVMAVGPGARDETGKIVPLDVTVGDRVLFAKWTGTDVIIDGRRAADRKGIRDFRRDQNQDTRDAQGRLGGARNQRIRLDRLQPVPADGVSVTEHKPWTFDLGRYKSMIQA